MLIWDGVAYFDPKSESRDAREERLAKASGSNGVHKAEYSDVADENRVSA